MHYTETEFAAALPALRPGLVRAARRLRRCSLEDAEDLVSQTVLIALRLLSQYQPQTGKEGLRVWLRTILNWVIRDDRKREACRVETIPLSEVSSLPVPEAPPAAGEVCELFHALPDYERVLVREWLAGARQREIARRHRLHRNTVASRLESAFAALRTALPGTGALTYSGRLLDFCSRITLYSKPRGVWRSWYSQHPPEAPFARYLHAVRAARERKNKDKESA